MKILGEEIIREFWVCPEFRVSGTKLENIGRGFLVGYVAVSVVVGASSSSFLFGASVLAGTENTFC